MSDGRIGGMRTHLLPTRTLVTCWALAICCAGTAAAADDGALMRCRSVADNSARLACYDALVPAATLPTAGTALVSPPPAPAAATVATFGLEQQRDQQLKDISSRIVGDVDGWGPRTRFKLENGQVWQISDDSSAIYALKSPRVKISRAVFSGFEMEIEGAKRAPRVKRVE